MTTQTAWNSCLKFTASTNTEVTLMGVVNTFGGKNKHVENKN